MKLYTIPIRYQSWIDKVDDNDGEITEDLMQEIESIEVDLSTKADAYAAMIRRFQYEEEAYREEARRMSAKAHASVKVQEKLRFLLMNAMRAMSLDRIRGKRFSISRILNKIPSISWESNQPIPPVFQKVIISLDKEIAHKVLNEEGFLPEGFKITNTEYVRIT